MWATMCNTWVHAVNWASPDERNLTRVFSFKGKRRYGVKLWKTFTDCFNCLPVAAIVDEKIFCCHGGKLKLFTHATFEVCQIPNMQRLCPRSLIKTSCVVHDFLAVVVYMGLTHFFPTLSLRALTRPPNNGADSPNSQTYRRPRYWFVFYLSAWFLKFLFAVSFRVCAR